VRGFADDSDERLMLRYQEGDVQAFEQLLERHRKKLFGYLLRMLRNREQAEDAFQEVFLRIVKSRMRYQPSATFTQWMYTIAHNLCVDRFRRSGIVKTESMDKSEGEDSDRSLADRLASSNPSPEESAASAEQRSVLEGAIMSLSPDNREVFLLRERQGLSFKEIARSLDIPVNTAKSRMRYAFEGLRKSVEASGFFKSEVGLDEL
jgi:RNA polymerase sigma-70 factor (ECF subfamily)